MKEDVTLPPPFNQFLIDSANQPRNQRSESEDALLVDPDTGLLGVFDSVGGRDHGRLVSSLAAATIASAWQSLSESERHAGTAPLEALLQAVIQRADQAIASLVVSPEQKRPATTVALGVLSCEPTQVSLTIAHVGDSRVYLLRAGQPIQRLTKDNGYFSFAIRRKLLTEEESLRIEQAEQANDLSQNDLEHFRKRHHITCAVGWTDFSPIQTRSLPLLSGDRVLFCTDGVHDNLIDHEIEEVLRRPDETSAQHLVSAASHRSQQKHFRAKQDDISAIVVRYLPPEMRE